MVHLSAARTFRQSAFFLLPSLNPNFDRNSRSFDNRYVICSESGSHGRKIKELAMAGIRRIWLP
jgi:hypothetical protein